ncbi:protein RDM1 isoform X2 [Salvia miltiorrhiza]|uniref:protein RDM1 isoform X2 n=2 Tax=Salvia miltiorrhiza TaxID=226208 RepID=UPI0025AD7CC0|nr:protein RDM1 isoform X2 [Salvia miltiorrhiza]
MRLTAPPYLRGVAMKRPASSQQVEISSDDDSSSSEAENDDSRSQKPNDEPALELSAEAWLFRRAASYQEYMKSIPIPTKRSAVIPYTSWTGLGASMKQMYEQPLHYLTNIHLQRMDRERLGAEDEDVPLDLIIHPCKAEVTIWLVEEIHRRTSSPHHLAQLWAADPMYHAFIDAIFPKLGS